MKKIFAIIFVAVFMLSLAGCNQADRVSANISKEADNFNVVRRLVVLNGRTDGVFMEVTGVFSFSVSSDRITIVAQTGPDTYAKHSCGLPTEAFWSVEDISGASVNSYRYEVNFLPEMIWPVEITGTDNTYIGDDYDLGDSKE